jgi:hypothetical protein
MRLCYTGAVIAARLRPWPQPVWRTFVRKSDALKKFEYQVTAGQLAAPLNMAHPKVVEALADMQRLGAEGWELVGMVGQQMGNTILYWKRELHATTEEWS